MKTINYNYAIRCAETGEIIDCFATIEEAKKALAEYVHEDMANDENETEESAASFYELYDRTIKEVI